MTSRFWRGNSLKLVRLGAVAVMAASACSQRGNDEIIFVDGRAVEYVGDSIVAVTNNLQKALLVLDLRTNVTDTIGRGDLNSPFHVQFMGDRWYVSDVVEGKPLVKIFGRTGTGDYTLQRGVDVAAQTSLHHQFAVLPNGRLVVEGFDNELVTVSDDSVSTFALTERGPRPSIIVAARGGVLHAVPDKHITLYNAFGNIRWQVEWPWSQDAFVTDIAVDSRARMHVIAGVPSTGEGMFRVYSMVGETGEVVWWSEAGTRATFSVSLYGDVTPDDSGRWF